MLGRTYASRYGTFLANPPALTPNSPHWFTSAATSPPT